MYSEYYLSPFSSFPHLFAGIPILLFIGPVLIRAEAPASVTHAGNGQTAGLNEGEGSYVAHQVGRRNILVDTSMDAVA